MPRGSLNPTIKLRFYISWISVPNLIFFITLNSEIFNRKLFARNNFWGLSKDPKTFIEYWDLDQKRK